MPADNRNHDDILSPRPRRTPSETAQVDPPDRATTKPDLRDRFANLVDEAQVVDVAPGLVESPPDAGPGHPIGVDIDRPEVELIERDAVESPFEDDAAGDTGAKRQHMPFASRDLDVPDDDRFYAQVDGQHAGVFHTLTFDDAAVIATDASSSFASQPGFEESKQFLADSDAEMHGRDYIEVDGFGDLVD